MLSHFRFFMLSMALMIFVTGCVRIPPSRKLPEHVRSIYVPMIKNKSYEPGIEELITRNVQERFLQEGQLIITNKKGADVLLEVVLKTWEKQGDFFETDEFPTSFRVLVMGDVLMYNIHDKKRKKPILTWNDIEQEVSYTADPRRSNDILEVDGRKIVAAIFASEVVSRVIFSDSEEVIELKEKAASGELDEKEPVRPPKNILPTK